MNLTTRLGAEILVFQPSAGQNTRSDAYMILCTACKGTAYLKLPMAVPVFVKKMESFNLLHDDCQPLEAWES